MIILWLFKDALLTIPPAPTLRYNTVIIERDYSPLRQRHRQHSYADLLVDPSTGLLLRPLSSLASEAGMRATINTLTALSFQLTTCWLLLYTEDSNRWTGA